MTEELEKRGIEVNKESLLTRVKNRRTIDDLEYAQEKLARQELGLPDEDSSDDSGMSLLSDEEMKKEEGEKRGRREVRNERHRSVSAIKNVAGVKNLVGQKRPASNVLEPGVEMDSDDEGDGIKKDIRGSMGKLKRSMTPKQRSITAKKIIRDRSASRREGTTPERLAYKIVPEEQVRLAKKINATFKHKI